MADLDAHSRLIAWLKIVLPLVALAILSTLFLVSHRVNPEDALPYAGIDIGDRLAQPRMTLPAYAGVTADGGALTLTADEAVPDPVDPRSGRATALVGKLETPDGAHSDLTANAAEIDAAARVIRLDGGVTIIQSNGWNLQTEALIAGMDRTEIRSETQVTATGPAGRLTADSMVLSQDPQNAGKYLLVFKGAVKLIYQPAN